MRRISTSPQRRERSVDIRHSAVEMVTSSPADRARGGQGALDLAGGPSALGIITNAIAAKIRLREP
jgi:hypothetical protein